MVCVCDIAFSPWKNLVPIFLNFVAILLRFKDNVLNVRNVMFTKE